MTVANVSRKHCKYTGGLSMCSEKVYVPKNRVEVASSSADNKQEVPDMLNYSNNAPESVTDTKNEQILAGVVWESLGGSGGDFVNLNTIIEEEKAANVIWLEEEHVKNTATIDSLTIEVELWKQKFEEERTLADSLTAKVSEWERRFSNQHEKNDIEVRNLKNENRKLNEALELHAHDESLLFGVMEKAVQMRGRVLETTEGGADKWR